MSIATTLAQQIEERYNSKYNRESEIKHTVKLRVSKQTSIKPNRMKRVLFVTKRRRLMYFEQGFQLGRRKQLMFAKEIMNFLPNRPYYTLIVNSTNVRVYMPIHMVIVQSSNQLSTVVEPEVACKQLLADNQPKLSAVNTFMTLASKQPIEGRK